jgi:hypothetical protein
MFEPPERASVRREDAADGGASDGGAAELPDVVERAVALLRAIDADELSVADALDRIETVTGDPRLQRRALDAAERRGVVVRDGRTVRAAGGVRVSLERDVVRKEGAFDCRRCGADIGTGCFVRVDDRELGPFGRTCVRAVLGRD